MMDVMDRNWARLGEKLKAARAARGMEQQDVAGQIGVKRGALRNIEKGNIAKVTPTVHAYARLVGWVGESVDRVLDGGEPVLRDECPPTQAAGPEPAAEVSDLSMRVRQALKEGPLIDSRVTEVKTPSGRVKATIVVRGEEGTPADELLAVLRALRIDVSIED
jgi:transcriptional regulator with XRE-family HTH domain